MTSSSSSTGSSRLAWLATAGVVIIAASYFFTRLLRSPQDDIVRYPVQCDDQGICLVPLARTLDRDGDGFIDGDEANAGANPDDAQSLPNLKQILDLAGKGKLESFNRGLTYIVALPTSLPNGKPLITGTLSQGRSNTLAALGINAQILNKYGLSADGGVSLAAFLPKLPPPPGQQTTLPPLRIGGVDPGWISQEDGGAADPADAPRGCQEGAVTLGCGSQGDKTFGDLIVEYAKKEFVDPVKKSWNDVKEAAKNEWEKIKQFFSGDKKRTSEEIGVSVPLTQKDYDLVLAKLGANRRPAQVPVPTPEDVEPGTIVGGIDPTIALVNPEDSELPPSKRLVIFVPPPSLRGGEETNTNFGPNGGLLKDIVQPGSGAPPPDPNQPNGRLGGPS